ncbi:MAG: hypothetical protein IPH12_06580 [Saprospirales bacterium]|nr:hypothetical protein [Saprospirales bacterium]MBK8923325.1 hypothetical protein [Saprospirales bacterium]
MLSLRGFLGAIFLCLTACGPGGDASLPDTGFTLPYRLNDPDTVWTLPPALREISGLGLSADGNQLLAINDEEGMVYFLDCQTGAHTDHRAFGPGRDYEGVEAVGTDIFAVRSNGSLYQIPLTGETISYPTPLYGKYDVEGLCYDSARQRLLLACKGMAGKADSLRHKKVIYAYNLKKHRLENAPAFVIDRAEIARWKGGDSGFGARLSEFFSSDDAPSAFGPSGLAICPLDGNLYVLAAVGKALAVLAPDGRILYVERLDPELLPQPEGICFDREGRLYICTEGKKADGRIVRFSRLSAH